MAVLDSLSSGQRSDRLSIISVLPVTTALVGSRTKDKREATWQPNIYHATLGPGCHMSALNPAFLLIGSYARAVLQIMPRYRGYDEEVRFAILPGAAECDRGSMR